MSSVFFAANGNSTGLPPFRFADTIGCMDHHSSFESLDKTSPGSQSQDPSKNEESKSRQPCHFSEETIESLQELGEVLRAIHNRLISEGFTIRNGKISKNPASSIINGENQNGTANTKRHSRG